MQVRRSSADTSPMPRCRALTTRRSRNAFFWPMRLLPTAQRKALYALHVFWCELDDIADGEAPRTLKLARRGSTPLCRLATAPRDASAARRGRPVRPAMRRFPCHHRRHGDGRPRRNPGAIAPTARSLLRSIASAWRSPSAASRCASSPLHFWPPSAKRRTRPLTLDPCKTAPEGEGRLSDAEWG